MTAEIIAWEQHVVALSHQIAELAPFGRPDVRERPGLRLVGDSDE